MQSINKMPSFGDDTLSACIKTEVRNLDIFRDESDMEKYFKDIISPTTATIKSNTNSNTKNNLGQDIPKGVESKKNNVTSKSRNKENLQLRSSKLKITRDIYLKRNYNFSKSSRRNLSSHVENEVKTSSLSKERDKSEIPSFKTNSSSNSTSWSHNITEDSSVKLTNNNISNGEKSTETNHSISTVPTQDRCKLASWGLSPNILRKYEARGISNMFPWQVECLSNCKVLDEKCNLVYSAPTSAGKTLVAEILMIKTLLERQKKVIFILPFISVVREKMYYFQDLLSDSGIRVEGFMGGIAPPGGFAATNVAIATIEKANSLVNRLMEENELSNLGAVVIDELHLVGDPNRGYLLELLLTKLKYMTLRDENINIQLIGMSATLPNLYLLAKWLNAELYKTEFRPIPLNEQCKIGTNIYDNKLNLIRSLTPMPELLMDADNILQLCIETISDGHSVLIFCPTKSWCEKLAEQIAAAIFKLGKKDTQLGETLRQQLDSTLISETLEQLKRSPIGLDNVLKNTVSFGIAFHHAGLTMDERDIIEGSFRCGSLRVLAATSTLSSGVNLPARRVIIRSPVFGGRILDSVTYKQMIGRAGRMGKDTAGESILICKQNERRAAESLLSATIEPIESCLEESGLLIRALLEAIASEVVFTPSDLELYTKCTLVSLNDKDNTNDPANEAIKFLVDNEFLLLQKTGEEYRWVATAFGKACLAASIPPKDGLFLLEELQKARRCFVLDTELHVIYLVTPFSSGNQILTNDWMIFLELWKALSESERRVGQLVGIEERFLTSAVKGIVKQGKLLSIHRRFYTALALHDLVREVPLNTVCKKYGCCRGVLQSLQQSASTFAGMVTQFCKQLGWDCMELLVSQFQTRLQFGVCRELLDLLRLPMLNGLRARSLYKQGITSVADLAIANELDVERALYKALPFESEKEQDGERESEAIKRNKMRTVFVTGKDGLTPHQAAVMLVQEARILVQNELGLQNMSWKPNDQSSITDVSSNEENLQTRQNTFEITGPTTRKTNEGNSLENSQQTETNRDNNLHQSTNIQNAMIRNEEFTDKGKSILNSSKSEVEECKIDSNNVKDKTNSELNSLNDDVKIASKNDDVGGNDLLQLDIPEFDNSLRGRYSLDFFEDSEPKVINDSQKKRNSDSLKTLNAIKRGQTQNVIAKHPTDATTCYEDSTPIKRFKTSGNMEDFNLSSVSRTVRSSDFGSHITTASRSPSLFDDSLNLDTQMFNVLEQNIDSLHFSEFEDTKQSQFKHETMNDAKRKLYTKHDDTKHAQTEISINSKRTIEGFSSEFTNLETKQCPLSWKDDSWNESKRIIDKVNRINGKNTEDQSNRHNIRNVKNTNLLETVGTSNSTPELKRINEVKQQKSGYNSEGTKRIPQKHKLNGIQGDESPVANVIRFGRNRGASLDSNKSDSDDVIVASQKMDSPATGTKIRSKLDSVKKQKIYTHKISTLAIDNTERQANVVSDNDKFSKKTLSRKTKLNEILAKKVSGSEDCSIENAISDSDEDTPLKVAKALEKSKVSVRKIQTDAETCIQMHKGKESANEMVNWKMLNVIKVGSDRGTFSLFKREVMYKRYIALALDCELWANDANAIGSKIISSTNTDRKKRSRKLDNYICGDRKLCGAAISWENNIAYYISFASVQESKISGKEQMKLLKELLSNTSLHVKCFATKETFKILYECCGIAATCKFLDPKIANWLHSGDACEQNFNEIVIEHFPQGCFITKRIGSCYETGPGLNVKNALPGEFRASAEAVLTWHVTSALLDKLENLHPTLLYTFKDIEMRVVTLLAYMELSGLGVSLKSLQDLLSVIRDQMSSLEKRAYTLSGKKFNFSSSKEVGEVLGLYSGKKVSVNKAVLGQSEHPISNLVISWRKLNVIQSKIVNPLLNVAQHGPRIHGNCDMCTLTGRISMHEPNLQNVPKDFKSEDNSFVISVRMAFVPSIGNIMLSADYCQLELRILAHFSKDETLCGIMRKSGDIFKSIAATWNHVSEEQVDDKMRQHTKQLCYGMIYGMGVKTLAENLSVDETKAKKFLETFMNAYPGIPQWLDKVLEEAREDGYVTTLFKRRRMLPGLSSTNPGEKSKSERQAVNTKVQGSAADIAKKAMIDIEERMRFVFPNSSGILTVAKNKRKLRSNSREGQQTGGYLVLQIHDELLYEVNINDLQQFATIVKDSMEQVCQLAVPLPIKIKVGPAWGDLSEYNL